MYTKYSNLTDNETELIRSLLLLCCKFDNGNPYLTEDRINHFKFKWCYGNKCSRRNIMCRIRHNDITLLAGTAFDLEANLKREANIGWLMLICPMIIHALVHQYQDHKEGWYYSWLNHTEADTDALLAQNKAKKIISLLQDNIYIRRCDLDEHNYPYMLRAEFRNIMRIIHENLV